MSLFPNIGLDGSKFHHQLRKYFSTSSKTRKKKEKKIKHNKTVDLYMIQIIGTSLTTNFNSLRTTLSNTNSMP